MRGVDGKEGQLARELKYVERLYEDLEEKVEVRQVEVLQVEVLQVEVLQVEVLQVYHNV